MSPIEEVNAYYGLLIGFAKILLSKKENEYI